MIFICSVFLKYRPPARSYLGLFGDEGFAEPGASAATVLIDEFDAGHFQSTLILAANEWISNLQFFDHLSLLQVFRIENGTSCAQGCRDDQSIID